MSRYMPFVILAALAVLPKSGHVLNIEEPALFNRLVEALFGTDGCEYDTNGDGNPWGDGNWATEWIAAHPGSELAQLAAACGSCAHSETLHCVL